MIIDRNTAWVDTKAVLESKSAVPKEWDKYMFRVITYILEVIYFICSGKPWFELAFRGPRIDFVFLRVTLSISLWNSRIKTFLLLEFLSSGKPRSFCLHFKLDDSLISYPLKCLAPKSQRGSLQRSLIPPNCWDYLLNFRGSLLKKLFEPCKLQLHFSGILIANMGQIFYSFRSICYTEFISCCLRRTFLKMLLK